MLADEKKQAEDAFGDGELNDFALSFDEINDLSVLRFSPPSSARFSTTVENFVRRALTQQSRCDEGLGAGTVYLSKLSAAMEESHNFPQELATQLHRSMLSGWRKHVTEALGQSLYTVDDVRATLDDVVNFAALEDGTKLPPIIQLTIHNAINSIEWDAPPTPRSHPGGLFLEGSPVQQAAAKDEPMSETIDEIFDEGQRGSAAISPTPVDDPKATRFSSPESFFKHHAMKAKKASSQDSWGDTGKQHAKSECKAEWNRMDMRTQADWQDLFTRWKQGDLTMAKPAATAHLFRDGVPTNIWSGVHTASPVAESKKRKPESTAAEPDEKPTVRNTAFPTPPQTSSPAATSKKRKTDTAVVQSDDPPPLRPGAITPAVESYHQIPDPQRTCFLFVDFGKTTAQRIAAACKSALVARHEKNINVRYEEFELAHTTMFLIRWRDVKTARFFDGIMVKGGSFEARAQAYPVSEPSIFIAHISHRGQDGIRVDKVHQAILRALPRTSFHLRHEKIEPQSVVTVWMAVFSEPPGALRFTTGIQTKMGDERVVSFEPLMRSAACPVCQMGHPAVDCDLLQKARRKELGLKKSSPGYLSKIPEVE